MLQIVTDAEWQHKDVDGKDAKLIYIYDIYENTITGFLTEKDDLLKMAIRGLTVLYCVYSKYMEIILMSPEMKAEVPSNPLFDTKNSVGYLCAIGGKPVAWVYF